MVGVYIVILSLTIAYAQALQLSFTTKETNQATTLVWTADDIVMAEQASGFQISPDNRLVIWVKSVPDKEKDGSVSNLILSSLTEEKEIQLTRGTDSSSSPKWSPDGQFIAFSTSRTTNESKAAAAQLWLINPFGGEPWKITDFTREISDYEWIDKDTILFSAQDEPSFFESAVKKNDNSVVIEDEAHEPPKCLFKYSIKSKQITRLTDNTDRIQDFAVSPDGSRAVTVHEQSLRYGYDNRDKPLVFLYDLKTGERRQIFNELKFNIRDVRWTPNGKGFYASNSFKEDPTYLWGTVTEMYYYDLASNTPVKVNLDWENGMTGSFTATDNGFVALLANGARNKPARYTREGKSWRREWITGIHTENIFGFSLGKDNKTLLYNHSTASKPTQWYRAQLEGNRIESPVQLTHINKRFENKQVARTELVRWKGALNEEVEGILYYPHNYQSGRKYPLVVMIHGGPTLVDYDAWKETWHYPHNLYTQRGAFVFAPNYHGSSNYGLKWTESIAAGNYYDLEVPDIEKGVDYLIGRGMVDPDKLGLLGWSNGSLLTIALTTQTTRYKAAGAGAGVVDWASDWANAYFGASFNNYYFGKSPLEDPQRYVRKSPFYQLDRVRTPTIIFFGENDRTVAPSQGWMHYRALQQLGKTDVRFVMFPGAGHLLRKLSHQRRKIEEELAWFDKYLFKTAEEKNEALKPGSPLAVALRLKNIKRSGSLYGAVVAGKIIPETVNYKNLEIGRFEVTRAQYAQFNLNYKFAPGTENYPANNIGFEQAQKYAAWLSRLTGSAYRLINESEAEKIYDTPDAPENTLDYWAGYSVNPEDAARLSPLIKELQGDSPLLKEVGSFKGVGAEELIFDLGGNVAEWVNSTGNKSRAFGGSADLPADARVRVRQPAAEYVGFRVLKESKIYAAAK
jgi:dipeptidyl aminopeptidase/acylaminoacyl peptidase